MREKEKPKVGAPILPSGDIETSFCAHGDGGEKIKQ